jgi:hypothetical protein
MADSKRYADQWCERGQIISVDARRLACVVETESMQGRLTVAFPALVQDPEGAGGEIYVPRIGQHVVVQRGVGSPYIVALLPIPVSTAVDRTSSFTVNPPGIEADMVAAQPGNSMANFLAKLPAGLQPGDWIHIGNQGQYLALFDGGVASLWGSAWAHVVASQQGDTLDIAGKNLKIHTGMGEISFADDPTGNKHSFSFQGGTDRTKETGPENWTIQAHIGGDAQGFTDFCLKDRAGNNIFSKAVGYDGRVDSFVAGIQQHTFQGPVSTQYGAGRVDVVAGTDQLQAGGDRLEEIGGSLTTTVSQNLSTYALNDRADIINRDWLASIGRALTLQVNGYKPPELIPGIDALKLQVSNGSFSIDVGKSPMDKGLAFSCFNVTTYLAKQHIRFTSTMGNVILNTNTPNSVLLGATADIATNHAAMWEPLQAFLAQLLTMLDAHTHATGVGPSGPPIPPFNPVLGSMVGPIMSTYVCIGK